MRALIRRKSTNSLHLDTNHSSPTPSPSHYTLTVHTTALTRSELTWPEPLLSNPAIPGFDVAGTILSTPSNNTNPGFKSGDEVYGMATFTPFTTTTSAGNDASSSEIPDEKFKPGDQVYGLTTFAAQGNARDISLARASELALKPKSLGWEQAASVPLSALSAWQGLFVHGRLDEPSEQGAKNNAGKRVLVTAAAGGVGVWAVQLARLAGVGEVVGTCGERKVGFVRELGADTVLDYAKVGVKDWVEEDREGRVFDVVFDCIGGQTLVDAWTIMKSGGRVISVAEPPEPKKPKEGVADGIEGPWFIVEPNGGQLQKITKLIEEGKAKGVVDSIFKLEDWEKAFERLEGGHAKGKVVLKLRE